MFKFLSKIFGKKSKPEVANCVNSNCDDVAEVEKEELVKHEMEEDEEVVNVYTLAEACKVLGKSDKTVRKMIADGKISGEKIGGKWRIIL